MLMRTLYSPDIAASWSLLRIVTLVMEHPIFTPSSPDKIATLLNWSYYNNV